MLKKKGFTLIELIIVLAIIGILSAILVPSILGYITYAKKRATVANAKIIYDAAVTAITSSEEVDTSFYYFSRERCPKNRKVGCDTMFEGTPDGRAVREFDCDPTMYDYGLSKRYRNYTRFDETGDYLFTVVARVDAYDHPYGGSYKVSHIYDTWSNSDHKYDVFVESLSHHVGRKVSYYRDKNYKVTTDFPVKMPYTKRDDDGEYPLLRWLVVYRLDDPTQIEVWAGDGTKSENGPVYRVYPNPHENFT